MPYSRWIHRFELKPGTWVFVPDVEARSFGSNLKAKLESRWKPPHYYAHLRSGGHVAALKRHIGDQHFMRVDIKSFFASIGIGRVTRMLKTFMAYDDAREAAKRSVVRNPMNPAIRYLPFGFVQSPIIASICLRQSALGRYVEELSKIPAVTTTVYMDDIIVSTNGSDDEAREIFNTLCSKAERSCFELSSTKKSEPSDNLVSFNIELDRFGIALTENRFEQLAGRFLDDEDPNIRAGILGYLAQVSTRQAKLALDRIAESER